MREDDAEPLKVAGTILVVEDEVLIRLVIAEYLRDCGYRVIEAVHADEALLVLRKSECPVLAVRKPERDFVHPAQSGDPVSLRKILFGTDFSPTAGCVSMTKSAMLQLLRRIGPDTKIVIS